ncbi:MAG: carbohydrate ABC transporter permease [bacterium]|nr:carbohydrate ABC transporter permease [bacterium]
MSFIESKKTKQRIGKIIVITILCIGGILYLLPFLWMIRTSLMEYTQLNRLPMVWIPNPIRLDNYRQALTMMNFPVLLKNTLIITAFALTGQLISCSLVAFGFARLRFPGRELLFFVLLSTMMLPAMVTEIPRFILFTKLGWVDTFYPLTVPAYFGGSAFFIFLLRQFFRSIPIDLDEAARIDGCSSFRIYTQIIMPLSKPVLTTVVLFSFIWNWNDFWGPLIYLRSADKKTLALGLQVFQGLYQTEYHYLMAATLVVLLPVIILFIAAQRYFVKGIVMTGIKG